MSIIGSLKIKKKELKYNTRKKKITYPQKKTVGKKGRKKLQNNQKTNFKMVVSDY